MKTFLYTLGGFAAFVAFVFGINFFSVALYASTAPAYTKIDNKVFHNSSQYTDGMISQLQQYHLSYAGAKTQAEKDTIKSIVVQQYASYDERNLDGLPDLHTFLDEMKNQ